MLLLGVLGGFAQGSWNPAGLDPSFPRTLMDSLAVPTVRASLTSPDYLAVYGSVWANANAAIPAGNSTDDERRTRSQIAREAAFVYLIDRRFSAGSILPLTQGQRDTLLLRVTGLLEEINTTVETGSYLTFYNPWQGRSKELIAYLTAYDLLKGAGVGQAQLEAAKTKLLTFTANLYQKAMATYTVFNLKFFTYQFNNHSIMTASALGLAAIVFNDYSDPNVNYQPQNWINAGFYNIDNTLWMENGIYPRVSEPDTLAGYAEGPNYFKYCFENAFPFLRAMWNFLPDAFYSVTFNSTTRSLRNLWYDGRYDRLYDWLNKIRLPNWSYPPIHDSSMDFGTPITALSGNPQYNLANPVFSPDDATYRVQFIATGTPHGTNTDSLFQSLPAAGSLVFRSSWETTAVYMHFIGKHGIALTGAKAHHQGDASSFIVAAFGELLALDPGYPGASQAGLMNKAIDHSLVLVNGTGPLPPTGEAVSTSTNTAYIEHTFDTPLLDYGEVRTSYQGAAIIRKNLFIRNRYFQLADFITSSSSNNYTFQLHGNGLYGGSPAAPTGAFVPDFSNGRVTYTRNSVSLAARITAAGGTSGFSYEGDSMFYYGSFRRYTKTLVQKNATTNALFLTTLFPYTSAAPSIFPSGTGGTRALARVQTDGYTDLVFCSQTGTPQTIPSDTTGMTLPVKGNGRINFYSLSPGGGFSSAFLQSGDSLLAGDQYILRTAKKMDVAWMSADSVVSAGYVSDTGFVWLYTPEPLQLLQGPAQQVTYDTATHLLAARFPAAGNFLFGSEDLTWQWTGTTDSNWHNPANWQLPGHPSVHDIPRATNQVVIPAGTPHMPTVSEGPATCHDLTISAGAMLTVGSLKFLTVEGTVRME